MLPLGDRNPTRRTPVVTWLLIALNVAVFLYELSLSTRALDRFMLNWGAVPRYVLAALASPTAPGAAQVFQTLVTSQFIHGGWVHLIGNMLFLYIFGDNIEDMLGHMGFVVFYLVCGVMAALAQTFVVAPFLGRPTVPMVGASGAIAGVLGAYLLLYPTARISVLIPLFVLFVPIDLPAFILIGWGFIQQLLNGLASLSPSAAAMGGVAFWAHLGGFATGLLAITPFRDKARRRYWWY